MKTDRNEAITENDQFLIIYSRNRKNEVLLRNAQIRTLQHFLISVRLRKQALFQAQTQLSREAAAQLYGFMLELD